MSLFNFAIIFIFASFGSIYGADDETRTVANNLSVKLASVLNEAVNYSTLSDIVKDLDGKSLAKTAIDKDISNLKMLFKNRTSTAEDMAKYAELVYKNHTIKTDLGEDYEYFNAMEGNESMLGETDGFSVRVTLQTSAVQTPTDLYQYTVKILNSIDWTKELDTKFKENYNNQKMKAWQYIGLSNGVYRWYPGTSWRNASAHLQYFDVRKRSWYIDGASSPKDMVIILDLSGSVIGNRLSIMRSAVVQLLDTLQENDFVTIVSFNKNARYLKDCWKHLVQATERNKKILKAAVMDDSVKGKNVANVDKGFKLAFTALEEAREMKSGRTSNCTQTIAFFTDGVEGDTVAEDVFDKYNSEKKVRVFTYLVGRENGSPFEAVKWIACNNNGFFYRIETLSDVRENIVKYVTVLSRSRDEKAKWTPMYSDAQGLGMTSALVLPIFDQRKKLVGVLGSDVRLDEILAMFPEPHLGAGGYPFAITNNGLVFFHPLLNKEEETTLKDRISVYLSEVMPHFDDPDRDQKLAKEMIDGKKNDLGYSRSLVLAKYDDKFRIVKRKLNYSYEHISGTSFSVGIAMTDYGSSVISAPQRKNQYEKDIKKASEALQQAGINISVGKNWPYCSGQINNWTELKNSLEKSECEKNTDLIDHVIFDITELGLGSAWKPGEISSDRIKAIFIGTTSGLTFYKSENTTFSTSIKQEYFERAADSWKTQPIIFSAPSTNEVHASKAVVAKKGNVLWGVTGIHMESSYLKRILKDTHNECEGDEDIFCYLLDENGYIVSSKEENKNGQFFGEHEGYVMEDLIDKKVYQKYNFTDVQATCKKSSEDSSSSVRLLDPIFSLVNYAKWWTQTMALSLIQYSLYTAMTGTNQGKAEDEEEDKTYACFKNIDLYFRETGSKDDAENSSLPADHGCQRSYTSSGVDNTNLLLVIVNVKNSSFCASKTKQMVISQEIEIEASCDLADHHRAPAESLGSCAPKKRESNECSSGKALIPSTVLLVLVQFVMLLRK
ncbi:voltage-dependent calcium channel subunit alpha-2/delta-3-like [Dendronephthya gigantea]|uniref:voltage-dependent calcium channel subunit alpha-2/delta-3-like n=2 Tax=Dendronephthya gigantea TaxID=151771 RepID=UPI00106B46D5|nr:voltage-dependent calcium channel subunit alpha-2/delta-3-like [Dendronephthya gigantea]